MKLFKNVALLEGISLLLLLFFAMPMKYLLNQPEFVRVIGMAHGLLFIAYIGLVIFHKLEKQWNTKTFLVVCLASVVPFGTFYIEKKYLRNA
jgi:integral membrane protein